MSDRPEFPGARFSRAVHVIWWLATSAFTVSFLILLGLSGSEYWRPDNELLAVCDRVLRISGLVAIVCWALPHGARLVGRVLRR